MEFGIAKCKDCHREIDRYASGVQWNVAWAWVRHRSEKEFSKTVKTAERFTLSDQEMKEVVDLLYKRATTQAHNTFVVHPPRKLISNPEIMRADDVIDRLENDVFEIVYQDGTYAMLSFPALMVFMYQHILLQSAVADTLSTIKRPAEVTVRSQFTVDQIMRPEMVKLLLSKTAFSASPSDGDAPPAERQ